MDLNNKLVLLTGASGGIGACLAQSLAKRGARLLLVGRNAAKLEKLQQQLQNSEQHALLSADLTCDAGREALNHWLESYRQQGQRISVLINNAGTNQFQFLSQRGKESLQNELNLNLTTPILLSQAALHWLERPGIILNVGSAFGSIGYPGYASYCAAKAGLHRFSEALDRELDGSGIRVLYLAPRATKTELNSPAVNELNQKLGNRSDEPQVVANHVIEMLEEEITARWIGWPEKLFAKINQWFPSLVSQSIRKQQIAIHHSLGKNLSHRRTNDHDVEVPTSSKPL